MCLLLLVALFNPQQQTIRHSHKTRNIAFCSSVSLSSTNSHSLYLLRFSPPLELLLTSIFYTTTEYLLRSLLTHPCVWFGRSYSQAWCKNTRVTVLCTCFCSFAKSSIYQSSQIRSQCFVNYCQKRRKVPPLKSLTWKPSLATLNESLKRTILT